MIDRELLEIVSDRVFAARSSDTLFNPYRDVNPELDRPDAAEIRRSNLLYYLAACSREPDVLLIAEAPAFIQRGEARQVILFQETEWSACIGCIANSVHEAVECPAPGLDDEQGEVGSEIGHVCLELIDHWIKMGILIQTYSPN